MKQTQAFTYARAAARAADEKMGENIMAIDVRGQTALADCFLFVTGTTHIHTRALEDAIRQALSAAGAQLKRTDGQRGHVWRALDYGCLIIHVMDQKTRDFYAIERLWEQGKKVRLLAAPPPVKPKPARKKSRKPARKVTRQPSKKGRHPGKS